ncbi:MAG: DUF1778 domain-containing protein [Chloroflexi bacterium]|nr:DUF1778 domain-containing protein [Chloroflexota bacterium]OJV93653.1 MAG: hypothetical protein BGO39_15145 [Chloroflexi bacterium 54-19]
MSQPAKSERIEARITPEALAVIRHAAEIQGRSLSDFITSAAQEIAHQVIEQEHIIRLSMEDQKRFAELLLDPPELSPAMLRAKEAHKRLIRESR